MFRIGQSSDIHQLVSDRPLILGGVLIPHDKGLLGHSDADCLLHAIAESIIGALSKGDLGQHFPDTDECYRGISSLVILEKTYELMADEGYHVVNLDALIMIETPKMAPYIATMKQNVAQALKLDINCINIKATRGEHLGFVGRSEGVLCQAVTLIEK